MNRIKANALDGLEPGVLLGGTTDKVTFIVCRREWETDIGLKIQLSESPAYMFASCSNSNDRILRGQH